MSLRTRRGGSLLVSSLFRISLSVGNADPEPDPGLADGILKNVVEISTQYQVRPTDRRHKRAVVTSVNWKGLPLAAHNGRSFIID